MSLGAETSRPLVMLKLCSHVFFSTFLNFKQNIGVRNIIILSLRHHDCANKSTHKNRSSKKTENGKTEVNKTANFCEVGKRKTRGKWRIM